MVNLSAVHNLWLENTGSEGIKLATFIDLAMELVAHYRDPRPAERAPLTEEEIFWALTGESELTPRVGMPLTARVMWVQPEVAGLKTDSGAPSLCLL